MKKPYIAPVAYDVYGDSLMYDPEDGMNQTSDLYDSSHHHSKQDIFVWDDDDDLAADDDWSYGW